MKYISARAIRKVYPSEASKYLQPGDIIVYRETQASNMLLCSLIMEFSNSPYSHAEIYVGDGWNISAQGNGVVFNNKPGCQKYAYDVFRPRESTELVNTKLLLEAYKQVGKPFNFRELFTLPWTSPIVNSAASRTFFCSEMVDYCYKQAGIDLWASISETKVAPGILVQSPLLTYVGSFKDGIKVEAEPFIIAPFQQKIGNFAKWLIKYIVNPTSKVDDMYRQIASLEKQKADYKSSFSSPK